MTTKELMALVDKLTDVNKERLLAFIKGLIKNQTP